MQPLVSVIMPAYNSESYVADSIESVVDQTYQNWELLVVDDGSTDKTADIVRQFSVKDRRIKYIFQQNGRQAKARNTGIASSNGTLLAFLDSDDLWVPEKLELQLKTLSANDVDMVYSNGLIFYEPGAPQGPTEFPAVPGKFKGSEMLNLLLLMNHIPVQSVLMRMDTFKNAGPFEESSLFHGCEDYDLWLKVAGSGAVFYGMTEKLIKYRRHAMSTTHKDSNLLRPMLRVVSRHINSGTLTEQKKRARLRRLYRDLIAALIDEGDLGEAQVILSEFSAWDKSGVVTSLQKLLMRISPRSFNVISRECLFRAEWHLGRLTGKH